MDKKRGIVIIISLILFLGVVDAAWILSYKKTITAEVVGGEEPFYDISWVFEDNLLLDTSEGSASNSTIMKIEMEKDKDVKIILLLAKNKSFDGECEDYEDDCIISISHVYDDTEEILLNRTKPIKSEGTSNVRDFTLFRGENFVKYNIECIEDSCSQKIISNVTIEGI